METPKQRLYNRESLIEKFKNGSRPEENDFKALIESSLNKLDDGLSTNFTEGLQLAPSQKNSAKLISFYQDLNQKQSDWNLSLEGKENEKSLQFQSGNSQDSLCTFHSSQRVGISNKDPKFMLDVAGEIGMRTRIGTFAQGELLADGNWHPVLKNLKYIQALEIIAHAYGEKGKGKYAVLHAFLMNAYAGKKGSIKKTQNYFGWKFWHRLKIRWKGTPFNYRLEIKTASNYGENAVIKYNICKLL